MAYDLSFSEEFFFAEGEPYDRADHAVNSEGQPVSVWSALALMPDEEWAEMVCDVFAWDGDPEHFPPEEVLEKLRNTDTCSNLNSPVEVWIDEEGDYTVKVWE